MTYSVTVGESRGDQSSHRLLGAAEHEKLGGMTPGLGRITTGNG
jgi:hypothetical protein